MTYDEVLTMAEETGLPYAYDHFTEGESPDPPFLVFLFPYSDNFGADGAVYRKIDTLHFELYTTVFFMIRRRCGSSRKGCMRSYTPWRF